MGMLFNTPGTLLTLEKVNIIFNQAGLNRIRNDGTWSGKFSGLPTGGTYSTVAKPLGIDHDDGTLSGKWVKWLKDYFDTNTTKADKTKVVATFVGQAIASAIADTNCLQVEFFAVPTAVSNGGDYLDATYIDIIDAVQGSPYYTRNISIYTCTMDQLKKGARA